MAEHDKTNLDYDMKNDMLYIFRKGDFKANLDLEDVILDIDKNNRVTGIEILDASKHLNISKDILSKAIRADFKTVYKKRAMIVQLLLSLPGQERNAVIAVPAIN